MMRGLIALALAIGVIGLISVYLSPDDLRRCDPSPQEANELIICKKADAIVVVSGGDTDARTQEAIELYRRGWAGLLIFSGAAADPASPSNAKAMKTYAIERGVPASAILTEEASKTTHENAKLVRGVFADHKISRAILVTSAYHQRRAGIEFSRIVGTQTQIIHHPVARDRHWSAWWWLTPHGWWLALSEIVKIILVYIGASR